MQQQTNKLNRTLTAGLAALVLATVAAILPADAHHAWRPTYDARAKVDLKGVVTSVEWINPHSYLHLTVSSPGKAPQPWVVEMPTPSNLSRRGLTRPDLPPGAEVTVRAYPAKDRTCIPACRAYSVELWLPDGRRINLEASLPAATAK